MDENIDNSQSGNPIPTEEEIKQNEDNQKADASIHTQAAGAMIKNDDPENMQQPHFNMQPTTHMVQLLL